jgi:transcription elongation factor Elf1
VDPAAPPVPQSILALGQGGHVALEQLDTALRCERCGRDTVHQILYLGRRIAEVRCADCNRCLGMNREDVVRAFIGEIVTEALRLPHEVTRGLKDHPGKAVIALPRQMAKLPVTLAQDAVQLLRIAWTLQEPKDLLETMFSQVDSALLCSRCGAETPHRIVYLGRRLAQARCDGCGLAVGMTREQVLSDFVGEAFLHLLKLPRHVRRELRSDFARALQTLPREMARMPFRLGRDLVRLLRLLRRPSADHVRVA